MGITDDPKEKPGKTKPALLPKPCMSSSAGSGEHVIPQMVITSVDDTAEESVQNGTEVAAELASSTPKMASADIHVEEETKNTEFAGEMIQQRPLAVGMPEEHNAEIKPEASSSDGICHSTAQRPLVFESEKPAPSVEESAMEINSTSSPPSPTMAAPTTMQRPLVFDGTVTQTEVSTSPTTTLEMSTSEEHSPGMPSVQVSQVDVPDLNTSQMCESPSATDKTKSSNFSWIPSFPKIHASSKEIKTVDEECTEAAKVTDPERLHEEKDHLKKDGMQQGMKKFFDSLIHDSPQETKDKTSKAAENIHTQNKEMHKEGKHGMKNLFSSSRHVKPEEQVREPKSEAKHKKNFFESFKHDSVKPATQEENTLAISKAEAEDVNKSQQKDSKHGIKKFLDSFKHENPDSDKRASKNLEEQMNSEDKNIKHDKEHHREGLPSIKKVFDSFRHEAPVLPKEEVPQIIVEQSEVDGSTKTPTKDNLHGVKKFFDSFKHDTEKGKKSPDSPTELEEHDKKPKEGLHGVKKFFDSFKHEEQTVPSFEITKSPEEGDKKQKDESNPVKKFFDSFKHEEQIVSHSDAAKSPELSDKKPKDDLSPVKKFFDSFKHDEQNFPCSDAAKSPELSGKKQKDDSSQVKKFFDSFKHGEAGIISSVPPEAHEKNQKETGAKSLFDSFKHDSKAKDASKSNESDGKVQKASSRGVTFSDLHNPTEQAAMNIEVPKEAVDEDKKQKDSLHGVKKFLDSFKQDGKTVPDPKKTQDDNRSHKEKHGVKKFFDSFKYESPELGNREEKVKGLQRSQSFKEAIPEKEPLRSVKSFFDFHHKAATKDPSQHHVSFETDSEHIYDFVDTSAKQKSFSSTSAPKTVGGSQKPTEKQKDNHQSVKKLFDSFRHKDSTPKMKSESISNESSQQGQSETIVPSSKQKSVGVSKLPTLKKLATDKHIISTEAKTATKVSNPLKKMELQNVPKIEIDEPSSSTEIKSSVLSSIGENILAIKDKVMHPKDAKKKEAARVDKTKCQEYDLQNTEKSKEFCEMYGKYTSLDDSYLSNDSEKKLKSSVGSKTDDSARVQQFTSQQSPTHHASQQSPFPHTSQSPASQKSQQLPAPDMLQQSLAPHMSQQLPAPHMSQQSPASHMSQQLPAPLMSQQLPSLQNLSPTSPELPHAKIEKRLKQKPTLLPGTPETLYDTCCMRIAVLLKDKALEIVSDHAKTPPKKPPKPSAEAIAKARAASVSRRLQELQCKGQSIGENIPVGSDGIRFADDETESSCDYKDVENFDYIMDYELINRYKFEKYDTFSVPSTCSGMTSYYTADTVTLKDESFSDAVMETVSLTDGESYLKHLSGNISEAKSVPSLDHNLKNCKRQPLVKIFASQKGIASACKKPLPETKPRSSSTGQTGSKKVPPPLPPKPVLQQKTKPGVQMQKTPAENSSVSQCINGLSLSPRLQTKFTKDSAGTQKRPLMVAGVRETDFLSLRSLKSKDNQTRLLKERKFDTVLKNESLKDVPSAFHPVLSSTMSSPPDVSAADHSLTSSLGRKVSPKRPPPPIISIRRFDIKRIDQTNCPTPPQKPKREGASTTLKEKRTISPPRPPPPSIPYKSIVPPRPSPPVGKASSEFTHPEPILAPDFVLSKATESISDSNIPICVHDLSGNEESKVTQEVPIAYSEQNEMSAESKTSSDLAVENQENISVSNQSPVSPVSDEVHAKEHANANFDHIVRTPKPPPRIRRPRSRTVEIVPVEKIPDSRLRRSQSLSDVDLEIKVSFLSTNKLPDKNELKSLYTKINKKPPTDADNVSARPLPAPPAPPRKFRSLDRKQKDKERRSESTKLSVQANAKTDCQVSPDSLIPEIKAEFDLHKEVVNEDDTVFELLSEEQHGNQKADALHQYESSSLKPPRRKRSEKHRFLSLHGDERLQHVSSFNANLETKQRSASVPLKPDRRLKQLTDSRYDENANIAFPVVAEIHNTTLDECGNKIFASTPNIPSVDTTDSRRHKSEGSAPPNPHQRKKNARKKSHSSWYDDQEPIEESFEVVSWDKTDDIESKTAFDPDISFRRKSDPGKKLRETSKFYVDVEQSTENLPLVDKETSPLPLDCSEKSVQTSLETLSQGIASRDEESEDTDELLNLAQNLQDELKIIINRHKSVSEDLEDDSCTPPLSAADSERNLSEDYGGKLRDKKTPSVRSSTSDLWPLSSSEESDGELANERSSNLTEIAMNRKQKKIFYIAQEIMTSEDAFVDALKLLNVDFKAAVDMASRQRNTFVIPDEVLNQILNHLPQLQHLNENLLMELKDRIEHWEVTGKIADVIVKMGPFLKLYSWYIHEFEANLALLEDSKKRFPLFAQVVKEFEMSERCKRLALNHFMLKPIQRIPQYRLLLQEYLHHLPEDSPDYQDTVSALQIVSEVANHANESMKQGDNAQKLISIQNSILGHKEIIKPGRIFVKEGELMKLSRKGMQPRWFVLFNDLLLYLTPVQQGLNRVNHELPLTGMKVAIPIQEDYQNEFSIISVTRSFTLAARSQEERQEWIIALTKAIEDNASKRSTFTNSRLQQKAQDKASEEDDGGFVLGRKAPVWIPDARVTMCQLCTSEFTVTFRRHHCRACGKVVCSICSSNRISLPYLGNRIARVCDECHAKLGPGSSACTESGETDSDNQQIAVKSHLRSEHRNVKKNKRNLPSVLKEVCANDQGSTLSGYLQKKSGKSWKRDWFVIKDKVLYEYRASEDVAALKSIPLLGYQIESFSEGYENIEPSLLFQLTHPGQAPIIFYADTNISSQRWIAALKEASVLE